MKLARRQFIGYLGAVSLLGFNSRCAFATNQTHHSFSDEISEADIKKHQLFMQEAITMAKQNEYYPFGAIIVNFADNTILARGVNNAGENPILHGEIVAINNYVKLNGNQGWDKVTLYTTGEPCPMCMSAIAWAGIKSVIWASDISAIRHAGIGQIDISAKEVALKSQEIYQPNLIAGGVLADVTDNIFLQRKK